MTALRALALLGFAAFEAAAPAHAQISRLPESVQEALAEIGPKWQSDIRTYIPRTFDLFAPLLEAAPKDGVTVTEDIAFGEDPKQKLDLFHPDGVDTAPVVVFVHGGALTRGDKSGRPGPPSVFSSHGPTSLGRLNDLMQILSRSSPRSI